MRLRFFDGVPALLELRGFLLAPHFLHQINELGKRPWTAGLDLPSV